MVISYRTGEFTMAKKQSSFKARISRIVGTFIGVFTLVCAGFYILRVHDENTTYMDAYISEPRAAHFMDDLSVAIVNNIPDVNNNRTIWPAETLGISYTVESGPDAPAFDTNISQSELANSIKITPAIRGKWVFASPDEIIFSPEQDWPAGTRFTIKLAKKLFTNGVRPDHSIFSFKTTPVAANIDMFNTYPAPNGARAVIGVAVVSFNYPIQMRDFADKVSMQIDGKRVNFDVKFDRYLRTAIIKTVPIDITDDARTLRFKLNRITATDGDSKTEKLTAKTTINAADNFFKISDVDTITADDANGNPQQMILVNMTSEVAKNTDWNKYITAYLLPRNAPNDENPDEPHAWSNDEITADVIKKSTELKLTPIEFANPAGTYQYAFSYDVTDNVPRQIYIDIKPNMNSANGFTTKTGLARVLDVAYPERSVKIVGGGALLSLRGDKKLSIVARGGVDTAYINLFKVESRDINHLITQTYNVFTDVSFRAPWVFDAYDMSVVFQKKIPFANTSKTNVNYAPLNLGEYLDRTYNDKTGIFIVKTGASQSEMEYGDARLILLTDLGIIRKINLDNSSVVFISKISSGEAASDVDVSVLGRNGYPIWAGTTDSNGRVNIPRFAPDEYRNAKEPVAIVARQDSDISFIPYNADSRQGDEYSKFDVGGVYLANNAPLRAFVFSDRGIYRPGETLTIGAIMENKNFTALEEIPLKIEILDPRGRTILDKKLSLASDGMLDLSHKLTTDSPIGGYEVNISTLNGRGHIQDVIGHGDFMVQEFVPDTMKIIATLDETSANGWISPDNIIANVSLNNLFGTPATDRRISAHALLRPTDFVFSEYKQYKFNTNFQGLNTNGFTRTAQTFTFDFDDARTDENGNATIKMDFDRDIPIGTYMLNIVVNGFEAGDGKSVQTVINSRVSNLDKLIGYKTNSDLSYLKRDSAHSINVIALDSAGKTIDTEDVVVKLVKRENLTSLIKDYSNHYKYQTTSHDTVISQSKVSISAKGTDIKLDTSNGGTYFMQLLDSRDNVLANIEYFVASDENISMQADTRAELQIKLDASEYKPGDTISIGITAPYTGTGLITIERDQVYAHKWFRAQTTASTQTITLPADFKGTGYINVSFVRDINSRDIFTTPYTYAVAPFSTKIDSHRINVKLNAPDVIKDNKLVTKITTDQDARVMLFAVNTGILQVANYSIPNPLKYFFQKSALQVETYQILSLLLPEYNILRQVAKTGGSDMAADFGTLETPLKNPFERQGVSAVAFYSGIINTKKDATKEITFDIPEYFNGAVSIYAVAAAPGKMGAGDTSTRIQSPVIISVSAPLFVAPDDKFTVNTVISNLSPESGKSATAKSTATTTGQIKIDGDPTNSMNVPENSEKLWAFDVVAASDPGTADIDISTALFDENNAQVASRNAKYNLSVRPATTFKTEIKTGTIEGTSENIKPSKTDMYSAFNTRTLYVSKSPSVLSRPMFMYLSHYDYTCSEQLISRTLPYVLMPENKLFGTSRETSDKEISKTIQTLSARQNADGSFGLWAGNSQSINNIDNATTAYLTAYAVNFLSLARRGGFNVPQSMLTRAVDFLRDFASQNPTSYSDAVAHAFAIYVLSANDYVTTSYIEILEEYANENIKNWDNGVIGAYVAASYKMLKQTDKAFNLISKYKLNGTPNNEFMFDNPIANDAIYLFITRNYFDMPIKELPKAIQIYINSGNYGSFTAAAILGALADTNAKDSDLGSIELFASDTKLNTQTNADAMIASIPLDAERVRINCPECTSKKPMFYAFITQGFPKTVQAESNGLEISRKYYDANGDEIDSGNIGDIVDVKIVVRTRGKTEWVQNAVISDLLPGGVTPILDSISGDMNFSEVHEDRILIYTSIAREPLTFTYRAQLTSAGKFTVPSVSVIDMYNTDINATTAQGSFTITNAAN